MLSTQEARFGAAHWASYHSNPRAFVYDLFRDNYGRPVELENYQAEILEGLARGEDVTVRSGHGVGKTTTDAFAVYFYLLTRPFSKVPTTAPTLRQVKDILWAEIAKWYQHFRLKDHLQLDKLKLAVRGRESEWFAIGVASNKPENIEGFHAPHVLFIVDEAKGVQKAIFDSIDGALTTGGQRLYTSTPGSRVGQFYESHFGRIARYFRRIHINGEHSPRVSAKWREQKAQEWGLESPIYQAKVMGEFPNEGDDILIRLDLILAAEAAALAMKCSTCGKLESRWNWRKLSNGEVELADECQHDNLEPAIPHGPHKVIGADIARYGMDETAAAFGSSKRIDEIRTWAKKDLVETTNRLVSLYRNEWHGADSIGVDDTGLGGGVTDQLAKIHEVPNMPVIFGSTSELDTVDRQEHFHNNKAYLCWKFRQALEENAKARKSGGVGTFALCNDEKLKGQLSNLRIRHSNKGKIQIIDPDDPTIPISELPKGVRVSPDRAHAAIICYHTATSSAGRAVGVFKAPEVNPNRTSNRNRRLSGYVLGGRG